MADLDHKRLHQSADLIGLRAHATAIGLIQLTAELLEAKVLDALAVGRIKDAIARDLLLSPPSGVNKAEFESWIRGRLDDLFDRREPVGAAPEPPLDGNASSAHA